VHKPLFANWLGIRADSLVLAVRPCIRGIRMHVTCILTSRYYYMQYYVQYVLSRSCTHTITYIQHPCP
jgi:hypothetical protein